MERTDVYLLSTTLNISAIKHQLGVEKVYLLLDQTCQKVLLESPTLEEKAEQYLSEYHHKSEHQGNNVIP